MAGQQAVYLGMKYPAVHTRSILWFLARYRMAGLNAVLRGLPRLRVPAFKPQAGTLPSGVLALKNNRAA